jgi:imidazole glycerol-phosphate synthase subunit HisH
VIAIIDYKAGNLTSVRKAFDYIGAQPVVTDDPAVVAQADKIVLPGVGHFAATRALDNGIREAVDIAIKAGKPFLGICVGMQWMFTGSEESPETRGLCAITGECAKFATDVKSPHVGWNQIRTRPESRLMRGVEPCSYVYFTHSYRAPVVPETVAETVYGGEFSAAVERDNIFGVQFHPEKSGDTGLRILRNFCEL